MANSDRIVIVAPNWLGDAVMALPAVADIRRHFPAARLTVAARRSIAPLFSLVDEVDEVLALEGRGGLGALTSWRADAEALAHGGFDTAVLLPNSFAAALAAARARIAERWGYATDWRGRLLTRRVPKTRGPVHQAEYYQALVAALGIPPGPRFARVRVDRAPGGAAPEGRAVELLRGEGIEVSTPFVVFGPGAAYGQAKQWLPDRFAELAALIAGERDVRVVLVGTKADEPVCDEIVRGAMRSGAPRSTLVNLAGRTDLPQLAGVLARARAVVCNDSGVMHLAGAIGVNVVAIFGATNERRTSPLAAGPDSPAPAIVTHDVFCRPCLLRECPIDHRCMRGVTARQVFERLPKPRTANSA